MSPKLSHFIAPNASKTGMSLYFRNTSIKYGIRELRLMSSKNNLSKDQSKLAKYGALKRKRKPVNNKSSE